MLSFSHITVICVRMILLSMPIALYMFHPLFINIIGNNCTNTSTAADLGSPKTVRLTTQTELAAGGRQFQLITFVTHY